MRRCRLVLVAILVFFVVILAATSEGDDATGPVDCYLIAKEKTVLTRQEILSLCHCADSAGPVTCYLKAQEATALTRFEILNLCRPKYWGWGNCSPVREGVP